MDDENTYILYDIFLSRFCLQIQMMMCARASLALMQLVVQWNV